MLLILQATWTIVKRVMDKAVTVHAKDVLAFATLKSLCWKKRMKSFNISPNEYGEKFHTATFHQNTALTRTSSPGSSSEPDLLAAFVPINRIQEKQLVTSSCDAGRKEESNTLRVSSMCATAAEDDDDVGGAMDVTAAFVSAVNDDDGRASSVNGATGNK